MTQRYNWQPWTVQQQAAYGLPPRLPAMDGHTVNDIDWHPTLRRLITQLPPRVSASFSTEQLLALSRATRPAPSPHAVEYRVSIPLFGRRYYFTLFAGRERRTIARLRHEGQLGAKVVSIAVAVGICLVSGAIALLAMFFIYLMKSTLGIDLTDGPSIFHNFLR